MKRVSAWVTGVLLAVCVGIASGEQGKAKETGQKQGMKGGSMERMMEEPHHKLVMGHKKHIMYFAQTLKSEVEKTGKVDKAFAEGALEEMERSVDQMKKHHDEHKNKMSADMRRQMGEHITKAESRFAALEQHVDLLDKELEAEVPDPKKVTAEADEIIKQCEMMTSQMKKGGKQTK